MHLFYAGMSRLFLYIFILMIISLQESRDSCAGLPVPGHANDAMTVSMNLILINIVKVNKIGLMSLKITICINASCISMY